MNVFDFQLQRQKDIHALKAKLYADPLLCTKIILKNWLSKATSMNPVPFPLQKGAFCIEFQKSRIRNLHGKDPFTKVPKQWEKQIVLGICAKEKVFESKFPIIHEKIISWDEFLSSQGQWVFTYKEKKQVLWLYSKKDDLQFFLVLVPALLDSKEIARHTLLLIQEVFPDLSPSKWESSPFFLIFAILTEKIPAHVFLFLFFLSFYLVFSKNYQRLRFRLLYQLIFYISLIYCFFSVSLQFLIFQIRQSEIKNVSYQFYKQMEIETMNLEKQFELWQEKLVFKITSAMESEAPLSKLPIPGEYQVIIFGDKGFLKMYPEPMPLFSHTFVNDMAPTILTLQSEFHNEPKEKFKPYFVLGKRAFDSSMIRETDLKVVSRMFQPDKVGKFQNLKTSVQTLYFVFNRLKNQSVFWIVMANENTLFLKFLKEQQEKTDKSKISMAVLNTTKFQWESEITIPDFSENPELWLSESTQSFSLPGKSFTKKIFTKVQSGKFPRLYFFYIIEKNILFAEIFEAEKRIFFYLFCGICFLLFAAFLISTILKKFLNIISKTISSLQEQKFLKISPACYAEMHTIELGVNQMVTALEEKSRFEPLVASKLIDFLSKSQSVTETTTILFSDIRSFTTLSQLHSPQEIVKMLNEYFYLWDQAVGRHGGVIEKFIGDAIVVAYPCSICKNHAQDALETALHLLELLKIFNENRQKNNLFPISIGIGIATGETQISVFSSTIKSHMSARGHSIHQSEELESLTKTIDNPPVLLDSQTASLLKDFYDFEKLEFSGTEAWHPILKL